MKFRFIDLFAGIGGFHVALKELGGECVFSSEWDKYCQMTYNANFGVVPEGDIREIDEKDIPDHEILCAGFPCQPFSQAGFKKGFNETRGTLFFDIVRIIKEKQPQAFFLENVRHLLKHDDGKTFSTIKKVIEDDLGYSFFYQIVRASDFGLPQHRPRLFMIGFRDRDIKFEFPKPIPLQRTMSDIWGKSCSKKVGFTLRVGGRGSNINDRRNWDSYLVDGKVQQLSPKEGVKMQGFPDKFKFPVSNAQAMKQLGNSVAVPAIKATADRIVKLLTI